VRSAIAFSARVVDAADDLVEAVVDRAVPVGILVPRGQPVVHVLASALYREVHDRRRAAEGRGDRARLGTCPKRSCRQRQLHVGVDVDATGDDVFARRVEHPVAGWFHAFEVAGRAERRDLVAVNQDVVVLGSRGREHETAADKYARHHYQSVSGRYMSGRRSR